MHRTLGLLAAVLGGVTLTPAAMAAPADLDAGFGTGGVALAASGRTTAQGAPLVQPSGKTIAVGVNAANRVVLERFTATGALDPSFGTGGEIVTDLTPTFGRAALADAGGGTFQVVVGTESSPAKITLERFGVDGALSAKVTAPVAGGLVWPTAAAVKADGSTYVAAKFDCSGTYCFGLAKIKGTGLDTTFAAGKGYVTTKIGSYSRPLDLTVAAGTDGVDRITVVGSLNYPGTSAADTALVRYKGTGVLDTAFDGDGIKTLDESAASTGDYAQGVAQSASGAITVAGAAGTKGYVARFTAAGAPDTTFGSAGIVRGGFAASTLTYAAEDVVLDASGRALVPGTITDTSAHVTKWAMTRLSTAGAFDSNFGTGGTQAYTPCANANNHGPFGVTLTGARIWISGECNADGRTAVARLISQPLFSGGETLAISPGAEGAGYETVRTAGLDPQAVAGSALALQALPLRANPLRANPLRANPLRANPLRANPLRANPLRANAIASKIILSEFPLLGDKDWATILKGYIDRPLQTITLADALASSAPGVADLTGADVDYALTPLAKVSAGALLLGDRPLAVLGGKSLLDYELASTSGYYDKPIQLAGVDLGSGDARAPLAYIPIRETELSLTPLGQIPAAQVSGLLTCGANCTGTLADQQKADPTGFSTATLGDLLPKPPVVALNVSLGDVMRGLIAPADIPFEDAPQNKVLAQADIRGTHLQTYAVAFTVDCAQASHLVAKPTLADDARVVPGSASVTAGGSSTAIDNPTAAGFDLGPACNGQPQDYVAVMFTFKVEPGSDLGPGRSTVDVTADGGSLTASASTTTDDSLDPGDDTTTARTLPDGDIVTGHIASPTDVDFFRIPAPSTGSKLTVTLTHLPADYDLSILGPPSSLPTAPLRANPLRANPLRANPVPDQTGEPIDTGTPADTLQDIPLRANPLRANPLRANSINRGGSDESATITATSADQGKDFFVAVTSFNGATDPRPYFVRATTRPAAAEPPCAAGPSLAGGAGHSLPASVPSATRALILVNQSRMQQRDGAAATNRVMTALNAIAPAMNTAVIPVDVGATSAAYAALDANPCSPDAANGVVTAINGVVDKIRSDNNLRDLQSIQIVGPDSEIPQARVVDQTVLSNESDYADSATFRGNDDAVSRAEREGYLLTDDVYGDFDPSVELYVPDVALGRLVESADQIADQVEAFNTAGGVVNPQRSFVAGYDFLADGAQRTFDALAPVAAGQLLQESWTADQARDGANAAGASFTSINGHYDNYRALPGAASSRLLGAGEVAPPAGSVLFTVGCHAGLNLALQLSGPSADEAARLDDWAEQVSAKKALYTANTGFGYGDTEAVAYSERLMADYADQLASRQVTAGQALMFAKQRDAAALSSTDDYWNKALMESTFYGIAMYRVGANGKEAGTVIPRDLGGTPDAVRASSVYTITPSALLNRHDTDSGSYWTAGQDPLVVQNRPIQPVVTTDVTPDDLAPVHGAEIEALSTTELTGIDHVIARPIVDDSTRETEPADANPYFPAQLLSTTPVQTPNGAKEKLTLVAGQSRDDVQRLINSATVRVYRSRSADYEPNVITRVDGLVSGGAYSIAVDVLGGDEDGGRVLFRTDASGAWQSVALAKVAPGRLGAGGALPAGATKIVEAQVWVHDTHGNTAFSNSKVVGYSFQPLAIAAGDPKIVLSPGAPATGYYSTPPTVTLDQGDHASAAFEYSIDNGAWKTYSGPVSVGAPTEGEHIVRVRGSDGSQALNRFAVDTQGPTVDASATTAPNFNNWYAGPVTVHFTCADAVSGVASCPADKTLASDGAGQSVSGTATDRAGLSGSGGLTGINIDTVKPTITGKADRAANADGWYNAPVTVTFTCADALSGIDACTAPVTVDEAQDGSAAGTARDKAGNEATASVDHLRVDRTDPTAVVTSAGLLLLSKVQGTAADADTTNPKAVSGVKSVKVTYTRTSGGTPIVKAATLTCNADRSSCTWVADPPSLGFWNVKADSTDLAGRTGTSAISTISIN